MSPYNNGIYGGQQPAALHRHGVWPFDKSWYQDFDPRFPVDQHMLRWDHAANRNCFPHENTGRHQVIQQRLLTAKAQGKQPVRIICRRPIRADSAIATATSATATLSVMYQLRLLGDLLARFQILDDVCASSLSYSSDTETCLRLWRLLHRPYADRIVAVLQVMEKNFDSHQLLFQKEFMRKQVSESQNWKVRAGEMPRLVVSHRLAPKEHVEDKKRWQQVTDVVDELTKAVASVLPRVEDVATKAADGMEDTIREIFVRFSI
ncbi:hypothetical protein MMC18_003253 [Xylographa bjoerkii]|nr:hypothetical protein [Xylographa bjoerkii]